MAEQDIPFERIGGYRVVRRLATGGTSDVLLARAEGPHGFERTVVLKLLLRQFQRDAPMEKMFAREAAAYARLSHPAIVKLFDFFSTEGQLVMVLEYIDGLPLNRFRAMLRKTGDALDDRASIFVASRIFAALAAAHGARDPETGEFAPMIHRDVNPSNVLLPWDGHVKLADFGIAKIAGIPSDTQSGYIKGTYGYMAPEQVRGEAVTVRTDVYAASLLLWELLARRKAIQRGALPEMEVMRAMADPSLPSLDVLRPDLPARLREAVARGLQSQPDQRTITAEEMLGVLRESVTSNEGRNVLVEVLSRVRPQAAELASTQNRVPADARPLTPSAPPVAAKIDAPQKNEKPNEGAMRPKLGSKTMMGIAPTSPIASFVSQPSPNLSPAPSHGYGAPSMFGALGAPPGSSLVPPSGSIGPSPFRPDPARPEPGVTMPAPANMMPIEGAMPSFFAQALAPAKGVASEPPVRVPISTPPPPPTGRIDAAISAAMNAKPNANDANAPRVPPSPLQIDTGDALTPLYTSAQADVHAATTRRVDAPSLPSSPPLDMWNQNPRNAPTGPMRPLASRLEPDPAAPRARGASSGKSATYALVAGGALLASAALVALLMFSNRSSTTGPHAIVGGPQNATSAIASGTAPATAAASATAAAIGTATASAIAIATAPATATATKPAPPSTATAVPTPSHAADLPTSTTGRIITPASMGSHRVFVDGKYAGDTPNPVIVRCGKHSVKIGSHGAARTVDIPCGGDVTLVGR